jgi:hypothetical protein
MDITWSESLVGFMLCHAPIDSRYWSDSLNHERLGCFCIFWHDKIVSFSWNDHGQNGHRVQSEFTMYHLLQNRLNCARMYSRTSLSWIPLPGGHLSLLRTPMFSPKLVISIDFDLYSIKISVIERLHCLSIFYQNVSGIGTRLDCLLMSHKDRD